MAVQQQKDAQNTTKDVLKYSPPPEAKPNKSQALIAEFQERLQHTLEAFKQKGAKQIAEELPRAAEGIIKRSSKELQKLAMETSEKLNDDLKSAGARLEAEIRRQFESFAQTSLDSLKSEAKNVTDRSIAAISGPLQEQVEAASENVRASVESVQSAAGAARSMLQTAAREIRLSLEQDYQKRVVELSASGLKDLQDKANRQVEDFEDQLKNALSVFRSASSGQLEAELSKTTATLIERSAAGLQRQVDHETEKLLARLRDAGGEAIEAAKEQLASVEQASIESISQSAKIAAEAAAGRAGEEASLQLKASALSITDAATTRAEAACKQLDLQCDQSVTTFQRRLAELSSESLESSWHKLDAQREAFCEQAQNSTRSIQDKALEEARQNLSQFAADILEKASGEILKQMESAVERGNGAIKSAVSALAADAGKRLLAEAQWSLHSLKETTAEQCKAQLSQIGHDFGADNRKKFSAEYDDYLRKFRKLAQSQLDELARHRADVPGQAYAPAVPQAGRSWVAGKIALGVAATAPTLVFLWLVSRPVMRLRPDPPADFLTVSTGWGERHPNSADKLASAYWDWAALHLARQYPYGSKLPEQPPFGFDVEAKDFPAGVDADLSRLSYWNELRKLWVQPQAWTRIEIWNRD